jgi:phosphate:Na+ symporter
VNYGIYEILTLLGALGLFLYGMKVMSDALMELAGDKMRNILATMTSNRLFAVFTGFLITAVIQSSSATTLMVVSFANASLLTLTESIGVIMGANIGTTVTAWLITILGFKVSMSAIALPLVGIGFLMIFSKKYKKWGQFIVGFALLFIGLQFLKDSVPDIKENAAALEFLAKYTQMGFVSVLIFLFIGTLLTVVIQSSSATMALTLVMCFEGWIPFDMAAAMVLGENIGTTITANLAALVANYHAKRTARAHLIFNLLGVFWMLVLFIPFLNGIDWFVTRENQLSPFVEASAIPVALSVFHTSFNVINTFVLIIFVPFIAKIVRKMVKEKEDPEKTIDQAKYLSEMALQYPQTGIRALMEESSRLFNNSVYKVIAHGVNVHRGDIESNKKLKEIVDGREVIEVDIDNIYYNRVKVIYNKLVEFASRLQSEHILEKDKVEVIRKVLIANRFGVEIVKNMKPLHKNISKYVGSANYYIKKEYNDLRKMLIKVMRVINYIKATGEVKKHSKTLEKIRRKARTSDVIIDGTINKLIKENRITTEMATSLMNDSANVVDICENLVKIAELLYVERDSILEELNDTDIKEGLLDIEEVQ